MLLERSATLLPRLVLCLSLLVATAGLAQDSEAPHQEGGAPADALVPPPLVPAEESPERPAPPDEVLPREQEDDAWGPARFAGRLLLQPPAGVLAGAAGGVVGFFPSLAISIIACEAILDSPGTECWEVATYSGTALSVSIGAGLGVMAVGYLLDGKARFGATLGGALGGSALGLAIGLSSGRKLLETAPYLFVGPILGATFFYTLSDAFFPETTRTVAPAPKEEDEYARVLPMVSTTRNGGIIGGLVGRF